MLLPPDAILVRCPNPDCGLLHFQKDACSCGQEAPHA